MSWWLPAVTSSSAPATSRSAAPDGVQTAMIRELAGGSRDALSQIYRLHGQRVFRAAYRYSASREIAEEVTQETFLLLLREPDKFDPARGELGAFLAGIARQLARRAIDKRHAASGAAWEEWEMPADAGVADILDEMIERQEFRQLHEAVATLPEPYRETLVLHHFEGLPYEAVAELLDCPVGTIRSRLARARAILARKLGKPPGHAGHHDGNENAKGGRTDGVAS